MHTPYHQESKKETEEWSTACEITIDSKIGDNVHEIDRYTRGE